MRAWLFIFGLACVAYPTTGTECKGTGQAGKKIFCYLDRKRSPVELDTCPCTHLLIRNQHTDVHSNIALEQGTEEDIAALRSQNPNMEILLSVGGEAIRGDTFRSIVSNRDMLTNFTSSINNLYTSGLIQGMELDWEWPMSTGDKKDKIKLIRYMRQIKMATGASIRRRIRSSETTTESLESTTDGTKSTESTTEGTESTTMRDEDIDNSSTTIEPEATTGYESTTVVFETTTENLETTTVFEETTILDEDDPNFNWRARGVQRKRKKIATTTETSEVSEDDEDALVSLEDVLFNETEDVYEDGPEGFILALRLSPEPFHLVKGFEFKMLNKFVDYFTVPSYNLTTGTNNLTYHHSRLMGVSDIQNTDALVDVVVGLGAPPYKIIITVPAFGNSFNLVDEERNLPGSAVTSPASSVTYQQVCTLLGRGSWTLEREEDLTGPYAYLGNKWLGFDDDTSLKIKAKYTLLRDLGGIGLVSIDADDLDDVCGKGRSSLLATLGDTLANLNRKPRQLIVTSLEQDLLATASSFSPVTQAQGLQVSPFRIVRIVNREGDIQSIRENSETILECSRQGYYRHPEDCSRFYRCVKFNQYEDDYTIFEYGCPNGLVFDDRWEVCVWPSQATPCDGSSEIFPIPRQEYVCPGEGFFVDPENCRWFFACRDHLGDGTYTHYEFRCPFGLAFDEATLRCDWPWLVSSCANEGQYSTGSSPLPSRKDFANNYQPAGTSSPFPAVPSIPSFESERTPAGSLLVGGLAPGDVVSEGCDNCYSPVLTITGNGYNNGKGIEVAGPVGLESNNYDSNIPLPGYGSTGAPQYSTTAQPTYRPTTPQPTYRPTTPQPTYRPTTPQPTYRPTPTYTTPKAPTPSAGFSQSSPGYDYPEPAHPLQYPSSTPAPLPSSSYNPSTSGYDYPVPQNPLQYPGISVSNPGEIGLISSPALQPAPVSPNIPAYGVSPTYPTTIAPVSTSYGSPLTSFNPLYGSTTPDYENGISSTYNPSVNTYRPIKTSYPPVVSSTYSPVTPRPTEGYEEVYEYDESEAPLESYGIPAVPVQETYGVPAAPVQETYGVPAAPVETYEEPLPSYGYPSPSPSPSYVTPSPIPSYESPSEKPSYGTPVPIPSYGSPSGKPSYGAPSPAPTFASPTLKPFVNFGSPKPTYEAAPVAPLESYGVPSADVIAYEEPEESYEEPLPSYGTKPSYGFQDPAYASPKPSYGSPAPAIFVTTHAPPTVPEYNSPSESEKSGYDYPVPNNPLQYPTPAPSPTPKPFVDFGSPAETYGVPAAPVVSSTYRPTIVESPAVAPAETYGVPSAPLISSAYDPFIEEVPLPSYGPSKDEGRPASLPDSWPNYPSSNDYNPKPSDIKVLPSPPKITYGGFKPPTVPEPVRELPKYQQPSYNGHPNIPEPNFGGFKGIPDKPAPSSGYKYPVPSNPIEYPKPQKPVRLITPNVPAYGPKPMVSHSLPKAPNAGYSYPTAQTPLQYPTKQPSYNPTSRPVIHSAPLHTSVAALFENTTPYTSVFGPTKTPSYRPSSPAPVVSTSYAPPAPTYSKPSKPSGYDYPAPSNPLQYPSKPIETNPLQYRPGGASGPKPEVASVIPSGFSSATLSNGPFSSVPSGNKAPQLKPFVNIGGGSGDAYGSGSLNSPQYNDDLPSYNGSEQPESGRGGKSFSNSGGINEFGNGNGGNRGSGGFSANGGNVQIRFSASSIPTISSKSA